MSARGTRCDRNIPPSSGLGRVVQLPGTHVQGRSVRQRPLPPAAQPRSVPGTGGSTHSAGEASTSPVAPLWVGVHLTETARQPMPQALWRLAIRAQRFTPCVSLEPPDGLLLEVCASLPLFGGVQGVQRALRRECAQLAISAHVAFAPTPLAALAAARCAGVPVVRETSRLIGALAPLPLAALRWPEPLLERLVAIGVRTIGQALRLPSAGFAQRFGTAALADLDRLTGRAPDLREWFSSPARFRCRRELPYESASHAQLTAALTPLLEALGRFLAARQCGVLELECRLWHRHAEPTRCVLRLASPSADAARLAELLGERLRTLTLPEPVRVCELRAGEPVTRALCTAQLWASGEHGGTPEGPGAGLIEQLRARLGPEAVQGVAIVSDPRPEAAWRMRAPEELLASTGACGLSAWGPATGRPGMIPRPGQAWPVARRFTARPFWLLSMPRPLRDGEGLPRYRGALRLVSEPERIETGWWDDRDVERDYYEAVDAYGRRLWLFRERAPPHRWFLQGVFA